LEETTCYSNVLFDLFQLDSHFAYLSEESNLWQASFVTAILFLETLFGTANLRLFQPIFIAHFLLN
jgi:hypothetical protein